MRGFMGKGDSHQGVGTNPEVLGPRGGWGCSNERASAGTRERAGGCLSTQTLAGMVNPNSHRRARLLLTSRVTVPFLIQAMHVVECIPAIIAELLRPASLTRSTTVQGAQSATAVSMAP